MCRLGGPQSENQRKWKNRKMLEPCKRTKKGDGDTNCNWLNCNGAYRLGLENRKLEIGERFATLQTKASL